MLPPQVRPANPLSGTLLSLPQRQGALLGTAALRDGHAAGALGRPCPLRPPTPQVTAPHSHPALTQTPAAKHHTPSDRGPETPSSVPEGHVPPSHQRTLLSVWVVFGGSPRELTPDS